MPKKNIVSFDEENLEKNKLYFAENPSVIKIDEPKTPFHKDDISFNFDDNNDNKSQEENSNNNKSAQEKLKK